MRGPECSPALPVTKLAIARSGLLEHSELGLTPPYLRGAESEIAKSVNPNWLESDRFRDGPNTTR